MPSIDLIFAEGNPTGIKSMMQQQGLCENVLRLPLVKATDTLSQSIQEYLNNIRF